MSRILKPALPSVSALCAFAFVITLSAVSAQDASNQTLTPKAKTKAEIKEEQAKAEIAAKKLREPFLQR